MLWVLIRCASMSSLCSLIWAVSVRLYILQYPLILSADNDGPDQPALMRRLIWACIVRKVHKGHFLVLCIISGFHEKYLPNTLSYLEVWMSLKYGWMSGSVDWSDCILQHPIWVYTICSGLSVQILRGNMAEPNISVKALPNIIHITQEYYIP